MRSSLARTEQLVVSSHARRPLWLLLSIYLLLGAKLALTRNNNDNNNPPGLVAALEAAEGQAADGDGALLAAVAPPPPPDLGQPGERHKQQEQEQKQEQAQATTVKATTVPTNDNSRGNSKPNKRRQPQQQVHVKAIKNAQQPPSQPGQRARSQKVSGGQAGANLWRPSAASKPLRGRPKAAASERDLQGEGGPRDETGGTQPDAGNADLQVSITPRVRLVRAPVGSNTILKCLISAQTNKFSRPFKISWSRYRYDENDFEQIESELHESGADQRRGPMRPAARLAKRAEESTSEPLERQNQSEPVENFAGGGGKLRLPLVNRQQQLRDFLGRSRQETNVISDLLIEATLAISPVEQSDNASYFCTATDGRAGGLQAESWRAPQHQAQIDLLALSKPGLRLERVQPARDSKSALVIWTIQSDGNSPIHKTILMVRNDSQTLEARQPARHRFQQQQQGSPGSSLGSSVVLDGDYNQWQRIEIYGDGEEQQPGNPFGEAERRPSPMEDSVVRADVDVTSINLDEREPESRPNASFNPQGRGRRGARQRSYNLTGLLPSVTYQLRLAATNDMGQSEWSQLVATMPNEVPAQISETVVLSTTNDSITIGWRRPPYDGAKTIRYEMQLFDLNQTMTLDANTNTSSAGQTRTNFMFHFVNLNPGTDYHFHIRACSRAGCSAWSTPKLLASTQDGEPDEPLDVELSCQLQTGQFLVSWLPPLQLRGKLLHYSVSLSAHASYRNQSGQWASEQWQSVLMTGDNHTLSLEAGSERGLRLMPNTNYTARVCAQNRARQCGRLSQVSAKARCSTPAELPSDLPASIQLSSKQLKTTDVSQTQPEAETLVLELPFISWRNGSIDCIQIVLIRLPSAYDPARRALSEFLPGDPAQIELHEYLDLVDLGAQAEGDDETGAAPTTPASSQTQPAPRLKDDNELALAYLAEELDQVNQFGSSEELAAGLKHVLLGDGLQSSCAQLWAKARPQKRRQTKEAERKRPVRAIDGSLMAQTHYTGFLRLVQLRFDNKSSSQLVEPAEQQQGSGNGLRRLGQRSSETGDVEVLTKYSNYFSPVRTGQQVPEVPLESLLAAAAAESDPFNLAPGGRVLGGRKPAANDSFCDSKLIVDLQNKLGSTRACQAALSLAGSARKTLTDSLKTATAFLSENVRIEALNKLIGRSSALMQLLEIGLLVLISSLSVLLMVYLLTLPSSVRRKRKRKLKRQLQQHEAAVAAGGGGGLGGSPTSQKSPRHEADKTGGFGGQVEDSGLQSLHHQIHPPNLEALAAGLGYQQVEAAPAAEQQALGQPRQLAPGYGTLGRPQECPIHSSPMSQMSVTHRDGGGGGGDNEISRHDEQQEQGRQLAHVCQQQQPVSECGEQPHQHQHELHRHHHHQHHHHSNYRLYNGVDGAEAEAMDDEEEEEAAVRSQMALVGADYGGRNCRTLRRPHQPAAPVAITDPALLSHYQQQQKFGLRQQVAGLNYDGHQHHNHAYHHHSQQQQQQQQQQQLAAQPNYTMTMQHDTVLALAKKINKSIPLSLFQSILECRLKNNWLREEYEQLPRLAYQQPTAAASKVNEDGRHIKLRPQLIVSRDDSVSALISGNDKYDGCLVKLPPPGGQQQQAAAAGATGANGVGPRERQFICAKSPVDADSVWDFWRLVYEREVSTLVMLTPNEDLHTGELRCAQYWPTCDNEETTILSPCNEFVQQSTILPAKFKIRQETLSGLDMEADEGASGRSGGEEFKIRRLTLLVMATRPSENEHTNVTTPTTTNDDTSKLQAVNGSNELQPSTNSVPSRPPADAPDGQEANGAKRETGANGSATASSERANSDELDGDEESLIIIERNLLHFQFLHWNANSANNQMRLIKFIELVNERHARQIQQQASPGTYWQPQNPILVHCANGIGRSGLFTAMSFVIDDLSVKLSTLSAPRASQQQQQQQQMAAKLNLFQLVTKLRSQRDMLLSPYRFYELLYQLTARCIPAHPHQRQHLQHQHHHHH